MLVEVSNLSFEYVGFRALKDISFNIAAGSITALVGPNGAGKSTLMRCLAALDQPISGTIHIDGINALENPRLVHRKIGYLSDFFGLYERLTVRQSLQFIARGQGISSADCPQAIASVCQALGIVDRLEMLPKELSRGLRQRVAIAQAIIHQPQIVLLDEPASGLDPEARHQLADLFIQLQQQGMTLIVSSHILAELEAYSSAMLVLRDGIIVEHVEVGKKIEKNQMFKVVLAQPESHFESCLADVAYVRRVNVTANEAVFELHGGRSNQHALLKHLVTNNLLVCEFSPVKTNLQDTYLSTVRK